MDKKEIIPIEIDKNDIEENSVLVVKRKKKRHRGNFFKKLLCLAFAIGLCYFIYTNFSDIKIFLQDKFTNEQNIENPPNSDLGGNNNMSNDNDTLQKPDDTLEIPANAYKIYEQTGNFSEISNETGIEIDFSNIDSNFSLIKDIYKQYGKEAPCVLIIHSACQEGYSNGIYYEMNDSFYSNQNNVASVGKAICDTLNSNNINAIHIDDIFANGSIIGSKKEYENALSEALKRYPSIAYVLDVSRNTIINDDLSMNKMIFSSDNKKVAQIKLTVGSSGDKNKDFWYKNLDFANKLALENSDLIYDVTLSSFELSQNISPIAMRVDIGAFSNSIDEAILSGYEFAMRLSKTLN